MKLSQMFEDPIIHNCPRPWKSISGNSKTIGMALGGVILFFGLMLTVVSYSPFFLPVCIIGIIVIFGCLRSATDNVDTWYWQFGYNEERINKIGYGIKDHLTRYGFKFTYDHVPKKGIFITTPYWFFEIYLGGERPLSIEIKFASSADEDDIDFFTEIYIGGVHKTNLDNSKMLANYIASIA